MVKQANKSTSVASKKRGPTALAGRKSAAAKKPSSKPINKPAVKPDAKRGGKSATASPASGKVAGKSKGGAGRAVPGTPAKTTYPPAAALLPRQKLVRDSFTMPRADFDLVDALKARAIKFQRPAKKSELLRAGLHALAAMSDAQLQSSLSALTPLKAGRPKNAS